MPTPPTIVAHLRGRHLARPATIVGTRTRRIFGQRPGHHRRHTSSARPLTKPSVRIAGMDLPAQAIKEGDFEHVDLTLLSIDEQKLPIYLQMRTFNVSTSGSTLRPGTYGPFEYDELGRPDGYHIRRRAVDAGIPLITDLQRAQAIIEALRHRKVKDWPILSWDEYAARRPVALK